MLAKQHLCVCLAYGDETIYLCALTGYFIVDCTVHDTW